MPNTPKVGLPYPAGLGSSNNPPADIKALADALDALLSKSYVTATATATCDTAGAPVVIPGLSAAIVSAGVADVFYVRLELDFSNGANTIWSFRPRVDGNAQKDVIVNMVGGRRPVAKTWRVTGLSAGPHTITATATLGAGTPFDIAGGSGGFTVMLVER